jgi:ABC-type multidrug transport system ATPase subunit
MSKPPPVVVLQVQGLCFAYPGQRPLFSGWSNALPVGITLLAGDTGSGKTSLLKLLAGELPAGSGHLILDGQGLAEHPAAYRQRVCWFDPRDEAWDALTPAGLMAAQRRWHPALDHAIWQRHLDGFELAPHLAKPLYALSTGTRRKAALAVALAAGAVLTLLDEPTAGLDAASLDYLALALAEAARQPGRALLLASSQGLEALPLAGTVVLPGPTTAG